MPRQRARSHSRVRGVVMAALSWCAGVDIIGRLTRGAESSSHAEVLTNIRLLTAEIGVEKRYACSPQKGLRDGKERSMQTSTCHGAYLWSLVSGVHAVLAELSSAQ